MQIPLIRAHVALHKDGARKDKLQLQTYSLLKTSFLLAQPTKVLKMATLCLELHELCPANSLRSREESTKTDSCSTRSGSTCVGYMSMLIIPVKRQAYTWTHTLASVDIYLSLGQDEHALHSIRKSPTKDRTSVKQRNQREIIVVRHKIPNTQ
jgi:hypothetical protein